MLLFQNPNLKASLGYDRKMHLIGGPGSNVVGLLMMVG